MWHSVHNVDISKQLAHGTPYTLPVFVRLVHTVKFSKIMLEAAYGKEIDVKFSGNSSGEHSCSQHANGTLPQLETSVALCCVTTAHFRVALYCPQHKVHLSNDHVKPVWKRRAASGTPRLKSGEIAERQIKLL